MFTNSRVRVQQLPFIVHMRHIKTFMKKTYSAMVKYLLQARLHSEQQLIIQFVFHLELKYIYQCFLMFIPGEYSGSVNIVGCVICNQEFHA